jgi:hypothetical protein
MPDRLAEIRARLQGAIVWVEDAWEKDPHNTPVKDQGRRKEEAHERYEDFHDAAIDDIAWLLDEVERLEKRVRMYEVIKS